jgi:hypothetical protein
LRYYVANYEQLGIVSHDKRSIAHMVLGAGEDDTVPAFLLKHGWAFRKGGEVVYGVKYIGPFKDEMKLMYDNGNKNKGEKMSPRQMWRAILRSYPERYDLPSEPEIQAYIGALGTAKGGDGGAAKQRTGYWDDPTRVPLWNELVGHFLSMLVEGSASVSATCSLMPAGAAQWLEGQHGDGIAATTEKIRGAWQGWRSSLKKSSAFRPALKEVVVVEEAA